MKLASLVIKESLKRKLNELRKTIKRPYCLLKEHSWKPEVSWRGFGRCCTRCGLKELNK
jgi:hypothetical protein